MTTPRAEPSAAAAPDPSAALAEIESRAIGAADTCSCCAGVASVACKRCETYLCPAHAHLGCGGRCELAPLPRVGALDALDAVRIARGIAAERDAWRRRAEAAEASAGIAHEGESFMRSFGVTGPWRVEHVEEDGDVRLRGPGDETWTVCRDFLVRECAAGRMWKTG